MEKFVPGIRQRGFLGNSSMLYLHYNLTMISVAIQAGGESRRMGEDKALLPFLGETLVERVMRRIAPLADELFITTNQPETYPDFQVPLCKDILPGKGALGGLFTALSVAQNPVLILVACDMPFINADLLRAQVERLHTQNADAVVPQTSQGYEPFHAVYRCEICLPAVQQALEIGERRLISWFPAVRVSAFSPEDIRNYDPQLISFWNINTKEDLARAEDLARSGSQ